MILTYKSAHRHGSDMAAVEVVKTTEASPPGVIVRNLLVEIGMQFASGEIQSGEVHAVIQGAAAYFRDIADDLDQKARRCIAANGKLVDS